MARKPRQSSLPLEKQLSNVIDEITKTEQYLQELKKKKLDTENQIEDRNMHDTYAVLKEKGITLEQLIVILNDKVDSIKKAS